MPTYKSKKNEPVTIYVDMTFRPGVERETTRYINTDRYPFLEKVSDAPYQPNRLLHDDVNAVAMSDMQDFYRSITLRVTGKDAAIGNTVNVAILVGDTDNIEDFIIFKEMLFTKKDVGAGIALWGSDVCTVKNVEANAFKFYYVAITAITVTAPVKVYAKTVI